MRGDEYLVLFLCIVLLLVYLILEYDPIRSGKTTIAFAIILLILFVSSDQSRDYLRQDQDGGPFNYDT